MSYHLRFWVSIWAPMGIHCRPDAPPESSCSQLGHHRAHPGRNFGPPFSIPDGGTTVSPGGRLPGDTVRWGFGHQNDAGLVHYGAELVDFWWTILANNNPPTTTTGHIHPPPDDDDSDSFLKFFRYHKNSQRSRPKHIHQPQPPATQNTTFTSQTHPPATTTSHIHLPHPPATFTSHNHQPHK